MISAGRLTFIKAQNDKICCSIESLVVVALRLNSTRLKFSNFQKEAIIIATGTDSFKFIFIWNLKRITRFRNCFIIDWKQNNYWRRVLISSCYYVNNDFEQYVLTLTLPVTSTIEPLHSDFNFLIFSDGSIYFV